jgi:hypothetical protein
MKKRILSVILCGLLVFSCVPVALAASDNSPPMLISCTPIKDSFTTGENVEFDIKVSDASGIFANGISIRLINKDKNNLIVTLWDKIDMSTADETAQGVYTLRLGASVNDNFLSGDYEIHDIWLEDVSGFRIGLYEGEFIQHSIYVDNTYRTDFDGPQVTTLSIDRTSISVGQSVVFTLNASDPAGMNSGFIALRDPDGNYMYKSVNLTQVGNDNSCWQGSFIADSYTLQGYYSIYDICFWDKLGNYSISNNNAVKFYVTNPNYNPGKPVVENISFSADSAKPGDRVKVTAKIDSKGTVVDYFQLYIELEDNNSILTCLDMVKDDTGQYSCTWTIPANYQACTLALRVDLWSKAGVGTQYFGSCNGYEFPTFRIESVFSGLKNISVPVGSVKRDTRGYERQHYG